MQLTPFFSKLGTGTAAADSAEPSQLLRGRGAIWNQGYLSLSQCFKPRPRGRATSEGEKQHRKDQVLTLDISAGHMASTAGPQETRSGGSYTIPPLDLPCQMRLKSSCLLTSHMARHPVTSYLFLTRCLPRAKWHDVRHQDLPTNPTHSALCGDPSQ